MLPFWNQLLPLKTCFFKCDFKRLPRHSKYSFLYIPSTSQKDPSNSCIQKEDYQTTEIVPAVFPLGQKKSLVSRNRPGENFLITHLLA